METAPKIESISLNQEEKELYQKTLEKYPAMTVTSWKKLREKAIPDEDTEERTFWVINGFLVEAESDQDIIKELSPRNLN